MTSEFRKSINSILFERVSSPLYGAFFFSWLVWNWEIIYLTLFISEESIGCTKIQYIQDYLLNIHTIFTLPAISTLILIVIVPFISNGAYWITLKFTQWRKNQKSSIEGKQLLTLERSIEIMKQINQKDREFDELIEKKNENEKNQNLLIDQLNKQLTEKEKEIKQLNLKLNNPRKYASQSIKSSKVNFDKLFDKINDKRMSTSNFIEVAEDITANNKISGVYDDSFITLYKLEGLIDKESDRKSASLTTYGSNYYQYLLERLNPN